MKKLICAVAGVMLAAVVPVAAQGDWQEVRPKRTRDYDDRKSEVCAIRVWVDDLVIIHTRGDQVAFETVRGQRAGRGDGVLAAVARANAISISVSGH